MTHIRNTTDGSNQAPRLRIDLNLGNVWDLPDCSAGPRGDRAAQLAAIKAAGYEGVQGGSDDQEVALIRAAGLRFTTSGRINAPAEAEPQAARAKAIGADCHTVHVAWGHESEAEVDALCRAILAASLQYDLPIYIETHRATITQDTWRTVQILARHPGLRLNGDFSHWYTGLEMPYGDFAEKLKFLAPAFERTRFCHARCGNSSHIQVPLEHPSMVAAMDHFRAMWTAAFAGFLRSAKAGEVFIFAPELLPPCINYARTVRSPDGQRWVEDGDRWNDAKRYAEIARECFELAKRQIGTTESAR